MYVKWLYAIISDTKQRHTSVRNYHSYAKYYVNTMIQRTISFLSGFSVHVNREAYKQYILFPYIDTRQLHAASASYLVLLVLSAFLQ